MDLSNWPVVVNPPRTMQTYLIAPEPPTDIWKVWWKVPVDPADTNMFTSDSRCPKVILNDDGKTLSYSNVPTGKVSGVFAANLAAILISASIWIREHQ